MHVVTSGPGADEAVDTLEAFVIAYAAWERTGAQLALAAHRLAGAGTWAADGSASMSAWLRSTCRMRPSDAQALLRRGRLLSEMPALATAIDDAAISVGQFDALTGATSAATRPLLIEQHAEIATAIAPLTITQTATYAAVWQRYAEAVVDPQPDPEPERSLSWSPDGRGGAVAHLNADEALRIQLEQALETASTHLGQAETRDASRRRADALLDIAAFFNANHDRHGTPRHRPHVELVVDGDPVARGCTESVFGDTGRLAPLTDPRVATTDPASASTADGRVLRRATTDLLTCDCVLHRVLRAGASVIDYGRATHSVPMPTWRALLVRDGGCRYPGCDRKPAWCDAHHIHHWRHGGRTDLSNLALLCSHHHHVVHQPGWHIKLLPDASVEVTLPDGRVLTGHPHRRSPDPP